MTQEEYQKQRQHEYDILLENEQLIRRNKERRKDAEENAKNQF